MSKFVIIKYYPNKDVEEQHEFVALVETGGEVDEFVLKLDEEQEDLFTVDENYFDIVVLPIK